MSIKNNGLKFLDNEDEELRAKLFELREKLNDYREINTRFIDVIKRWNEHAHLHSKLEHI